MIDGIVFLVGIITISNRCVSLQFLF